MVVVFRETSATEPTARITRVSVVVKTWAPSLEIQQSRQAGRQTVLGEGEAGPPTVAIATVRRYRESDPQGWEDYLAEVDELTGADAPIGDE